eukprot:15331787-Ditylum_brightwellii.AAC.1
MSLQAECSRHKLETRRFADESARATAEAKEMNDIVNLMRLHTKQIIFEKESIGSNFLSWLVRNKEHGPITF